MTKQTSDHLITLSNGRTGLRSGLHVETSEPSPNIELSQAGSESEAPTENQKPAALLDFIASDETLDRCDEIIAASGWRLEAYRRNPVFQNAHQYGDVIFTIGKALITEVRLFAGRPSLFQRVQFAVEANPMARIAYALYKGKFLNAVSVGFIPLRWEDGEGERGAGSVERWRGGGILNRSCWRFRLWGFRRTRMRSSLGSKQGLSRNTNLQEMAELLRSIAISDLSDGSDGFDRSDPITPGLHHSITPFPITPVFPRAVPDTHARASGVGGNEAQLLQLARDVLQVLRNT